MSNPIALIEKKNEALVDSRVMAEQLGITHEAILKTIDTYSEAFQELQPLRFEIAVAQRKHGGGTPIRYALLSEDQSFLLLTFSRNTKRVVALKLSLIQAFGRFRRELQNATDYLPFYHELHDAIKAMTTYARQNGSASEERVFHMTYNKLINKYCGIEASHRQAIGVSSRVNVTNVTAVIIATIKRGIESDTDYHEIYKQAKANVISVTQIKQINEAQVSG